MLAILSGGHGPTIEHLEYLVDFIVFVSAIIYFVRKPVAEFVRDRRQQLVVNIDEAKRLREEAEKKLQDYEERLANLQSEIDQIMLDAQKAGEDERQRIVAAAAKTAERIRSDASTRLDQEQRKLSHELRVQVVEMALQRSHQLVNEQISTKDHERFVAEYVAELDKLQGGVV